MLILHPTKSAPLGGDGYMADGNLLRLGGVSGLMAVVSMIPAYLVGYPDAPGSLLEAQTYFDAESGMFVFSNGMLPLFHVFFFLLFLGVLYGLLRSAGGQGNRRGTTRGGARRKDRIRDALGGRVHSRDLLSSGPAALRRTPIRHRFRARIADALLMAVPLLPDRGVSHGALHLHRGDRNACLARMACSGWIRGCTTDVLAFSTPYSGRIGGSGMGGGGLGSDADRGQPEPSDEAHPLERSAEVPSADRAFQHAQASPSLVSYPACQLFSLSASRFRSWPSERFAVATHAKRCRGSESSLAAVRWRGDPAVQTAGFMILRINPSSVESAVLAWRCLRSGLLRRLPFSLFGTVGTRPQLEFMGCRVPSLVVM